MTAQSIEATAQALMCTGKRLVGDRREHANLQPAIAAVGIAQNEEARRAYRELLVTTPGLGNCISGAILYDETMHQRDRHGTRLVERLIGRFSISPWTSGAASRQTWLRRSLRCITAQSVTGWRYRANTAPRWTMIWSIGKPPDVALSP